VVTDVQKVFALLASGTLSRKDRDKTGCVERCPVVAGWLSSYVQSRSGKFGRIKRCRTGSVDTCVKVDHDVDRAGNKSVNPVMFRTARHLRNQDLGSDQNNHDPFEHFSMVAAALFSQNGQKI
jgi:hypothetical protein